MQSDPSKSSERNVRHLRCHHISIYLDSGVIHNSPQPIRVYFTNLPIERLNSFSTPGALAPEFGRGAARWVKSECY
jgi:hypothetical protein